MSPAQGQVEAAARLRGTGDDPPALEHDDVIVLFEAGSSLESVDEPRAERDGGHHGAADASGPEDVDAARHGKGVGLADPKAAGCLNGQIGATAEHPCERTPVSLQKSALEGRRSGELASGSVCRSERLLVGGQSRPESRLQARVDPPGLAPRRDRRKTPESSRQGKEGQQ